MNSIYPSIKFPFVYLDSSTLLRSSEITIESFTRKQAIKHPQEFLKELNQLKEMSQKYKQYYKDIVLLQRCKIISTLITYETINEVILNNNMDQIALFGTIQDLNLCLTFLQQDNETKELILWGEAVDIKTYNQAALSIAQAECVVVDPYFMELSVGKSLINYISSTCKIILLGIEIVDLPLDNKYTRLNIIPEEFFTNLLDFLN